MVLCLRRTAAMTLVIGPFLAHLAQAADGVEMWRIRVGNVAGTPVVAKDGTIYAPSTIPPAFSSNGVLAVNADGSARWSFDVGAEVSCLGITPSNRIILTAGSSLHALNRTGQQLWRFDAPAALVCPAIASDGSIFVGAPGDSLYALRADGTVMWRKDDVCGGSSPSLDAAGNVYVYGCDNALVAVDRSGVTRWTQHVGAWTGIPVSVANDGTIYAGGWNQLTAIHPDGSVKWRSALSGFGLGTAIGPDGVLLTGTSIHDGNVYATNPDGSTRWIYPMAKPNTTGHPVVGDDGTTYVGSYFTGLHAIGPDGTTRWILEPTTIFRDAVMSSEGTLFAIGAEYLVAVGTSSQGPANAGWSMRSRDQQHTSNSGMGSLQPFLAFPLRNRTADTAVINSYFDHSMTKAYRPDNSIVTYNNMQTSGRGCRYPSYNNVATCTYGALSYDGHPGYDFKTTDQDPAAGSIPVLAAASGRVTRIGDEFNTLLITHDNGYRTRYLHMSTRTAANTVREGDEIGMSGATGAPGQPHLHFQVERKSGTAWVVVDPYGWTGCADCDPYEFTGPRLWK